MAKKNKLEIVSGVTINCTGFYESRDPRPQSPVPAIIQVTRTEQNIIYCPRFNGETCRGGWSCVYYQKPKG